MLLVSTWQTGNIQQPLAIQTRGVSSSSTKRTNEWKTSYLHGPDVMTSNSIPCIRIGVTSFIIKLVENPVAAAAQGEKTTAIFTAGRDDVNKPAENPAHKRSNAISIPKSPQKPAAKEQGIALFIPTAASTNIKALPPNVHARLISVLAPPTITQSKIAEVIVLQSQIRQGCCGAEPH
ncbi:hypothetical protein BDD12DRAFT_836403 [Trichophaea hybrida]|nr:hypothetical protein BDD12DRAFT_836403 [Trichophaea hybrida]